MKLLIAYNAFMRKNLGNKLKEKEYEEVRDSNLKTRGYAHLCA
jgi:hypothetical protein